MLRLLFHHRSKLLYLIEAAALIVFLGCAWRVSSVGGRLAWIIYAVIAAEYAFIRTCAIIRWYKDAQPPEGIELQFKKAILPAVYILLIGALVFIIIPNTAFLIADALLLALVAHVNVILIYLHFKDKDPTPVNYFSRNKHRRPA